MTPQGTDLWLKTAFGFIAIVFVLQLPTWALGLLLALGFIAKAGINLLREPGPEHPTASSHREHDAH